MSTPQDDTFGLGLGLVDFLLVVPLTAQILSETNITKSTKPSPKPDVSPCIMLPYMG